LLHVRERWAIVTNEALREAHIAARIDHRSLEAQGIDREPHHIPRAAFEMERHGYRNVLADRLREESATRLHARLERAAAVEPQSLEDIRRQARENWLRMRQGRMQAAESAPAKPTDSGRDDDLTR